MGHPPAPFAWTANVIVYDALPGKSSIIRKIYELKNGSANGRKYSDNSARSGGVAQLNN